MSYDQRLADAEGTIARQRGDAAHYVKQIARLEAELKATAHNEQVARDVFIASNDANRALRAALADAEAALRDAGGALEASVPALAFGAPATAQVVAYARDAARAAADKAKNAMEGGSGSEA